VKAAPAVTRRLVVVAVVLAVAQPALLFGAAAMLWSRPATTVSEDEALARFRAQGAMSAGSGAQAPLPLQPAETPTADATAADGAETSGAGAEAGSDSSQDPEQTQGGENVPGAGRLRPAPGVYSFSATGFERVALGPAADTRPYSGNVTATVRSDGECWTFQHDLFVEHTETTRYCAGSDGTLRATSHTKTQRVAVVTAQATLSCTPDILLTIGGGSGPPRQTACDMRTTTPLFTASIRQSGTVVDLGEEPVTVGGAAVAAHHVRIRRDVSGDMAGHWHEDIWFSSTDFTIVRIERDAEMRGPATFTEKSAFVLNSMSPRS